MASLCDLLSRVVRFGYPAGALRKTIEFLRANMIDPQDGIWTASVGPDERPKWDAKMSHSKANYHDFRAIAMLSRAFADR